MQEVLTLEIAPRGANFTKQDTEKKKRRGKPATTLRTPNLPPRHSEPRVWGIFACRSEIGQSDATCGQWRQRHLSIRSESPGFFGSPPESIGMRLRNEDGLPKCKSVLCSPLAWRRR